MSTTFPPIAALLGRPATGPVSLVGVREQVLAGAQAGADLSEIEQALIEPAPIDEDEKAALWLLAWCSYREKGMPCLK